MLDEAVEVVSFYWGIDAQHSPARHCILCVGNGFVEPAEGEWRGLGAGMRLGMGIDIAAAVVIEAGVDIDVLVDHGIDIVFVLDVVRVTETS